VVIYCVSKGKVAMKRVMLLCVLTSQPAVFAAEPPPITLDEALRRATEQSPSAQAIALGIERARAEIGAAGLWPNPALSVSREESAGTVERFENLSLPFVLTNRLSLERTSARSGLAAEEASARQERAELRARVHETFLDLLLSQERTVALETGRSRLSDLVEALRAREREGESSGFDRMRAERELAELEVDLAGSNGGLRGARAALAAFIGAPSETLSVAGSLGPGAPLPGLEEARALARRRGDVVALDAQAERADLLARAARRRVIPEPSVLAGRKTTEDGGPEPSGPVLGISFSIPLFDRGQGARGVSAAEAALLRARREALARQVEAEAEAAYARAVAARDAEEIYVAAGDAEQLVSIARAAYEGGVMRILELLDAYRTALAAQLRLLELQAAARRAEAVLGRALGTEGFR
jgi:outer membrane protein TolC